MVDMGSFPLGADSVFQPCVFLLSVTCFYVSVPRRCRVADVLLFLVSASAALVPLLSNAFFAFVGVKAVLFSGVQSITTMVYYWFYAVVTCHTLYLSTTFTYSTSMHLKSWSARVTDYWRSHGIPKPSFVLVVMSWVACGLVFLVVALSTGFVMGYIIKCLDAATSCALQCVNTFSLLSRACVPLVVYLLLWSVIFAEAKRFNRNLRDHRFENTDSPALQVEEFRLRHFDRCSLVDQANGVVRHFLFSTYAGGIPVLLLTISIFVYSKPPETMNFLLYIAMYMCVQMAIVTLSGAALVLEMQKPSDILSTLRVERLVDKPYNVIAAFQSQFQRGPIGFHVYRLFTIDTNTILTVCGTVLTYAVLTVQLNPNDADHTPPASPGYFDVNTTVSTTS